MLVVKTALGLVEVCKILVIGEESYGVTHALEVVAPMI